MTPTLRCSFTSLAVLLLAACRPATSPGTDAQAVMALPQLSVLGPSSIGAGACVQYTTAVTYPPSAGRMLSPPVIALGATPHGTFYAPQDRQCSGPAISSVILGGSSVSYNFRDLVGEAVTLKSSSPGMAAGSLPVTVVNPQPTTSGLSPTSVRGGSSGFVLTVTGTRFVSSSTVQFNGSDRVTTYLSDTKVTALIPASDVAQAGSAAVTVTNPAPGGGVSNAQGFTIRADIFAFEAPKSTDTAHFDSFVSTVLPHISGPGFIFSWSAVDDCGTAPCATEPDFNWSVIDDEIMAYVDNTATPFQNGCDGEQCKIILILWPTSDTGPVNRTTPQYVFSSDYARSLGAAPQDVMICNAWKGATLGGKPPPITSIDGGFGDSYATWNVGGGTILTGSNLEISGNFPTSNFSGFPVVYEKPFLSAYEHFLKNVLLHYSASGSGSGPAIAPYVSYIRIGAAEGGENFQYCALRNDIPYTDWQVGAAVPAGYLIRPTQGNPGKFTFVSNGSGHSGASAPAWCQTAYCDTGADGTISGGWRNTGAHPPDGVASNAMWPGPQGQAKQPNGFSYNGYLTTWGAGGDGYMATLLNFIVAQRPSIRIDIASNTGVPFNVNWNFADSEAILAAEGGVGFGMEALTVDDPLTYAAGVAPTTRADWAENFNVFATDPMVRHLQMAWPGGGQPNVQAEEFSVTNIRVESGTATVTCTEDCSTFCGAFGATVYLTGTAHGALDGVWQNVATSCASNTVTFPTSVAPGNYPGGAIYAEDYLPITIPFAQQRHATSVELQECTLDYAYGAQTSARCAGSKGPDATYQAAIEGK